MLKELFKDYNPKHSTYQISNWIIGLNGRTKYGQYKQVLRELYPRYRNILSLVNDKTKLELEIETFEKPIYEIFGNKYKLEIIKQDNKRIELEFLKANIERVLKEFIEFYSIALQLKQDLGDISNDIDQLEKHYWVTTFKEKIAIEFLANGRLAYNTIEAILAMPERMEILEHINSMSKTGEALNFLMSLEHNNYIPQNLISNEEALNLITSGEVIAIEQEGLRPGEE